ncbi:MAG: apolipoprotein N-acyltransferase [Candidatus Eremiobacteraeota bacterium]|nr:apolipoprotein N-acyltransferase [Candidatus Eremiobacteraeota bacterium]
MTVRSTALALVCAFGLHLAFPLTGWWWLAPLAIAGLTASWSRLEPRWAALVGFASGMVFFAFGFSWMGETAGALLGPGAPILDLGPALIEAPAFAFAAWVTSLAARRCDVRLAPVAAAAAFTLAEVLRSTGVMGAPLEQIGVAMIDSPLRPIAAYLGVYGITFATVLLGTTLGWWLLDRHDARRTRTVLAAWLGVAACAALAWAMWPARHYAPPARRVAAVQGGIAQTLKMSPEGLRVAVERYTTLTVSLAPRRPTLVLWPETVITTELNAPRPDTHDIAMRIAKISRDLDATVYAGSLARIRPSGTANAIFVYDPHGERGSAATGASGVYAKEQLVPFAEYVPGPAWLRTLPYADQIGIYVPGTNRVRTFDGATPLICWESLFGDIAHARLAENPSLLLIATDDAWFGTTEFPYEHAMAATVRAVETGRWVLRAGATGISGIVAPDGTWTQRTQLGGPAVVVGDVGAPAPGPYAVLGPTPIGMALALVALMPFLRRGPRRT